jgi:hypothetical protein
MLLFYYFIFNKLNNMRKHVWKAVLLATLPLTLWMNGCKKSDQQSKNQSRQSNEIPEWVLKKWDQQSNEVTYIVNDEKAGILVDKNGNEFTRVNSGSLRNTSTGNISTTSFANCDGVNDDDIFGSDFVYKSQSVLYHPTEGFSITANYYLYCGYQPTTTVGKVRIRDANGVLLFEGSTPAVELNKVGIDPVEPNRDMYELKYTVSNISKDIIAKAASYEYKPYVYTTCPGAAISSTLWQKCVIKKVDFKDATTDDLESCNRIDKMFWAQDGRVLYVQGCNYRYPTTDYYAAAFRASMPDEHEIEWRQPGSAKYGNWPGELGYLKSQKFDLTNIQRIYLYGAYMSVANGNSRVPPMLFRTFIVPDDVTGKIEIRYRNVRTSPHNNIYADDICRSAEWAYLTFTIN